MRGITGAGLWKSRNNSCVVLKKTNTVSCICLFVCNEVWVQLTWYRVFHTICFTQLCNALWLISVHISSRSYHIGTCHELADFVCLLTITTFVSVFFNIFLSRVKSDIPSRILKTRPFLRFFASVKGTLTWQQRNPALLLRAEKPRSNVGQVAHVSPTPWVTSQEADITRRAPEAAC